MFCSVFNIKCIGKIILIWCHYITNSAKKNLTKQPRNQLFFNLLGNKIFDIYIYMFLSQFRNQKPLKKLSINL
jgi:hypothetical protein